MRESNPRPSDFQSVQLVVRRGDTVARTHHAIEQQLRRDSNPQPPDSKSDTLSIAPRSLRKEGRGRGTLLARAEAAEVLGRLGHDVRAEGHLDAPRRLAADGHVEEDLWCCDGFFRSRRIFCQCVCLGALGTVGGARGPLVAARLAAAARVRVRASRAQTRCLLVFSSARAARSNFCSAQRDRVAVVVAGTLLLAIGLAMVNIAGGA